MGVNLSKDTSRLEVCFGGFAPTAMNAGVGLESVVDRAEALMNEHKATKEHLAAIEKARASEQREWVDEHGTSWTYVVLDGSDVRVERCSTQVEKLALPACIENKPLVAIAADACAYLPSVVEIECPDSVISVGYCAFRGCKNLKRAKLPSKLTAYDSGWFRGCAKLEHVTLPGGVERIDSSLFDAQSLRTVSVGEGTREVMPGAFGKSRLTSIEVAEKNPHLKTDGKAIYTKDGNVFVALAVPVEKYRVIEGCRSLARKAFSCFESLRSVELPSTLEVVEGYAFSRTNIALFDAPPSLRKIEERAFFNCKSLRSVRFEEGLREIEEHAFTGTALEELHLPSTIEELGNPLAVGANLTYAGPCATFGVAPGGVAGTLQLDEEGGLYRETSEGLEFVLLLDPKARFYEVRNGVVNVRKSAFARHENLAEVKLPDSVRVIGEAAFMGCRALRRVNIPKGVREIGAEAFLDTNIESICLPAGLESLGAHALVTQGAHYSASVRAGRVQPSLREVQIGEGSTRFLLQDGLLLERVGTEGSMRVLLCTGSDEVVRIPVEVNEIAPYAFNNVRGIRELYLSDRIVVVGIRGLAIDGFVELIHVNLVKAQHGRESFELRFPDTDRGRQQMMLALSVPDHVSVQALFSHYDTAITNGSSFDAASEKGLALYEQATRLLQRLLDPVYLSEVNRQLCERFLRNNVERVCIELAKHDDRASFEAMFELGFLNAENIYAIIDRVGAVQDAAMTNYLLEARRSRFEQSVFDDFDL